MQLKLAEQGGDIRPRAEIERSQALRPCTPQGRKAMAKRHSTNRRSCWEWQGPCPLGEVGH